MAVQTFYGDNINVAFPGEIANQIPATLISRTIENAAGVQFGAAVSQGNSDYGAIAFTTGSTEVLGVVVRDRSLDANVPDKIGQNDTARVMTKGAIWVTASVAVDAGDPVYVVPATGAFAKTSASSAVLIPGARWDTSTTDANQLAIVRLG